MSLLAPELGALPDIQNRGGPSPKKLRNMVMDEINNYQSKIVNGAILDEVRVSVPENSAFRITSSR